MPQLFDQPFSDGGLIMRQDYLEEKGFDAPKTFDDLYEILKAYKADHPDSYPCLLYTSLSASRRNISGWAMAGGLWKRLLKKRTRWAMTVSYTNLDVYKRQAYAL